MQLPGLLIEYLVTGSCALIWIWILFLIPGVDLPEGIDVAQIEGVRAAIFVPILYVVGMIVDFLSLILVRPFVVKYLRTGRQSSSASTAKIMLRSAELGREYIIRSSRDRIARGIFMNCVITTIVLTVLYPNMDPPRSVLVVLPVGLVFSGLCFGMWVRHERVTYNYLNLASDALKETHDGQTRG